MYRHMHRGVRPGQTGVMDTNPICSTCLGTGIFFKLYIIYLTDRNGTHTHKNNIHEQIITEHTINHFLINQKKICIHCFDEEPYI